MAIISLVLSIFGLGAICWLLFSLAVYALPFCVGMTIAFAASHGGSGVVIAFGVGAFCRDNVGAWANRFRCRSPALDPRRCRAALCHSGSPGGL
jgi:hypothetical protein